MRILIVSNLFPPGFIGGYELGALDVAKELASRGHDVHVLTSNYFDGDLPESDGLSVERSLYCAQFSNDPLGLDFHKSVFANPHNVRLSAAALRRLRPDAVLMFNLTGLGAHALLRFFDASGVPLFLYLMDNVLAGQKNSPAHFAAYKAAHGNPPLSSTTRVIAMSQIVAEEFFACIGREMETLIVPGWADLRRADFTPRPRIGAKTRFVFASRIAKHKGVDILLDALETLVGSGVDGFEIDFYGNGDVAWLTNEIAARRLGHAVAYRGELQKEQMLDALYDYDCLVLPTWRREPLPFIVCEAAVAGCVPIFTQGIGVDIWFVDGEDCLKISRNPRAVAQAMRRLLEDGAALERLRARTFETSRRNFSFQRNLDKIEAALAAAPKKQDVQPKQIEAALTYLNLFLHERQHGPVLPDGRLATQHDMRRADLRSLATRALAEFLLTFGRAWGLRRVMALGDALYAQAL